MYKDYLTKIYERDLEKLHEEILQFQNEEDLWITAGDVKNSAGNLVLHLCGNLQHFIGHVIGGTDYVRDREKEFSLKNVPKEDLISEVKNTTEIVLQILNNLNEEKFSEVHSTQGSLGDVETGFLLLHLTTHLSYHLGQINYLRRLMLN